MANQLPSFLSGSNVVIKIGDMTVAFCQDLRFNRTMTNVPVRGIGSYSVHTLEPVDFSVSGQMSIVRFADLKTSVNKAAYQSALAQSVKDGKMTQAAADAALAQVANFNNAVGVESLSDYKDKATSSGNSLLDAFHFDPRKMLLTSTFDIEVYDRKVVGAPATGGYGLKGLENLIYQIMDCRLSSYSINFVPGQLLIENVTFLGSNCRSISQTTQKVASAT